MTYSVFKYFRIYTDPIFPYNYSEKVAILLFIYDADSS